MTSIISAALWSREDMESKFSHSAAIYEIHKSLRFLMRGREQWDISVKKNHNNEYYTFPQILIPVMWRPLEG